MDFLQQIPASYGRYIKDNPTTNPNVTFHIPMKVGQTKTLRNRHIFSAGSKMVLLQMHLSHIQV